MVQRIGGRVDFVDRCHYWQIWKDHLTSDQASFTQCDILDYKPDKQYNIIICNPPWTPVGDALTIYNHLVDLLSPHGYLFFVINYAFINTGWKRGSVLGKGGVIFLPRYLFAESLRKINPESTGLLDPVLMIHPGKCAHVKKYDFFCPIPPSVCKEGYDRELLDPD
jgi:hypothetical protein